MRWEGEFRMNIKSFRMMAIMVLTGTVAMVYTALMGVWAVSGVCGCITVVGLYVISRGETYWRSSYNDWH